MSQRRLAVVLFNLGGPDGPASVRPFLFNLFRDPAIISVPAPLRLMIAALIAVTRTKGAQANYALMGGGSPLLKETKAQADALRAALQAANPGAVVEVFVAMRYWHPLTDETARQVAAFAPDDVVLLPLYPQFSTTTTGSSLKAWAKAYRGQGRVRTVCCYPAEPGLIEAHARRIEQVWIAAGRPEGLRLLFSAHGLPQKVVDAGDPYQRQVEETVAALVDSLRGRLGADWDHRVCYQSRVGPLKWLGPSTPEAIQEAAEEGRGILISPVAFVSEHVETLVELDVEYAHLAERMGAALYLRAPALGVEPAFIDGLSNLTGAALAGPADSVLCPSRSQTCPVEAHP